MSYQVLYQPVSTKTDMYCVYIDDVAEYKKWLDGDESIPLASFVGRFEVYHSMQGAQGQWAPAPKGQLASDLGSEDKDECIKIVLRKGGEQQGDRVTKQIGRAGEPGATLNAAKEGANSVSLGSQKGGGHGGR